MPGIIKSDGRQTPQSGAAAVAFNLDDISTRAQKHLDEIRHEAAKIVAEAKREAAQIRDEARQQGRRDAINEAEKSTHVKIEQQLQHILPAIQEAVTEIQRERAVWIRQWEQNALKLAIAIAERVIRREVQQQPQITLDLMREAIQLAARSGRMHVRLNPKDYEMLRSRLDAVMAGLRQIAPSDVIADPTVTPGGCQVETEFGTINQQFEAQLARIQEELS